MRNKIALFVIAAMFAPSAFAAEITPYIGISFLADKAGTSAKRVGFDPSKLGSLIPLFTGGGGAGGNLAEMGTVFGDAMGSAVIINGGDNMNFNMAFAGEFTAGLKMGNFRGELEFAIRSASEDGYELFSGDLISAVRGKPIQWMSVPTTLKTSTAVRHNSYMANLYYDFDLSNTRWTPYVGAGIGIGQYVQEVSIDINIDTSKLSQIGGGSNMLSQIPQGSMVVADDTLTEFEWQIGLGAVYNFTETWALDIGYRFNSANVSGEFVYAHEVKLGARYSF